MGEVQMATKRNVLEDLLGDEGKGKKVTKASVLEKVKNAVSPAERAKLKAAAKANGNAPAKKTKVKKAAAATAIGRSKYEDDAKISIKGDFEPRDGAKTAKFFKALKASKTIGDFRAARKKMGETGLGKMFAALVENGVVTVK